MKNLTSYLFRSSRCIAVLLIAMALSCNKTEREYGHPEYFDTVFNRAEHISSLYPGHTLGFVDSAFDAFPRPDIQDLYRKYIFKAHYFIDVDKREAMALLYADSALWAIRDHVDEAEFSNNYGKALSFKAFLLTLKKEFEAAFECCYRARQVVERTHDTCLLSDYTFMLGAVSNGQRKYLDAARYLKQGIVELSHCSISYGKFRLMQAKLDDIGIYYSKGGMPDSALYYYKAALDYLEQHRKDFPNIANSGWFVEMAEAVVHGNMGDVYYKKGDTVTAENLYRESIRVNTQEGYDEGDAQHTRIKLAGLYIAKGRLADAQWVLQGIRHSLDRFPDQQMELKWYRLQFSYLERAGRASDAWPYVPAYLKLKDSLENAKQQEPQFDMNEGYGYMKSQYDLSLLKKDGELKTLYLMVALVFLVMAAGIAATVWQHGKRLKRLNARIIAQNAEMQKALHALEQSQEENTRMMKIVAHDLRTPIGGIIGLASIVLEGQLLDGQEQLVGMIKTSGSNALEFINDLLHVNSALKDMKKEPVEVAALLRHCVGLLQFKADGKGQQLVLETVPVVLPINQEKVWRVISNLITNAIKFSPDGATINVSMEQVPGKVRIAVEDHGIGIPDSLKNGMFKMFTEAKRPGTAGEESFGLGLAISKQIIEAHGGQIWFESSIGKGTTFFIELPLTESSC